MLTFIPILNMSDLHKDLKVINRLKISASDGNTYTGEMVSNINGILTVNLDNGMQQLFDISKQKFKAPIKLK